MHTAVKAREKSKCHMDTSVEQLHGLVLQCWASGNESSVADLSLDPVIIQWGKSALKGFENSFVWDETFSFGRQIHLPGASQVSNGQMSRTFSSTSVSQNVHEETVPTGKELLTSARSLGQQDELALDRETVHSQNDSPNREGHRLPLTDNITGIGDNGKDAILEVSEENLTEGNPLVCCTIAQKLQPSCTLVCLHCSSCSIPVCVSFTSAAQLTMSWLKDICKALDLVTVAEKVLLSG